MPLEMTAPMAPITVALYIQCGVECLPQSVEPIARYKAGEVTIKAVGHADGS